MGRGYISRPTQGGQVLHRPYLSLTRGIPAFGLTTPAGQMDEYYYSVSRSFCIKMSLREKARQG